MTKKATTGMRPGTIFLGRHACIAGSPRHLRPVIQDSQSTERLYEQVSLQRCAMTRIGRILVATLLVRAKAMGLTDGGGGVVEGKAISSTNGIWPTIPS
jgi:hypothetical protein